jgi:transcriptional regulator with XRE-family HTH domain
VGEHIKRLRQERGYTQQTFAKRAKISQSFLQSIEQGKRWVGPKTITALARPLKVSESELFRDCAEKTRPDPKDILLLVGQAFGVIVDEKLVAAFRVRTPPHLYAALYDRMPDEIFHEFSAACQQPHWDWEKFRRKIKLA